MGRGRGRKRRGGVPSDDGREECLKMDRMRGRGRDREGRSKSKKRVDRERRGSKNRLDARENYWKDYF